MKILKKEEVNIVVEFSEQDLRLILGSLREVGEAVEEFEFYARVGGKKTDVHKLCVELKAQMENASINI